MVRLHIVSLVLAPYCIGGENKPYLACNFAINLEFIRMNMVNLAFITVKLHTLIGGAKTPKIEGWVPDNTLVKLLK